MMTEEPTLRTAHLPSQPRVGSQRPWLVAAAGVVLLLGAGAWFAATKQSGPIAALSLADGRTLQIEGMTYGTEHRIGQRSIILEHFGPWLPRSVGCFIEPKYPE